MTAGVRVEDAVLAGSLLLLVVALAVLQQLHDPASWLSRSLDRGLALPEVSR